MSVLWFLVFWGWAGKWAKKTQEPGPKTQELGSRIKVQQPVAPKRLPPAVGPLAGGVSDPTTPLRHKSTRRRRRRLAASEPGSPGHGRALPARPGGRRRVCAVPRKHSPLSAHEPGTNRRGPAAGRGSAESLPHRAARLDRRQPDGNAWPLSAVRPCLVDHHSLPGSWLAGVKHFTARSMWGDSATVFPVVRKVGKMY